MNNGLSDIGGRRPKPHATANSSSSIRPDIDDPLILLIEKMTDSEVTNSFKTAMHYGSQFERKQAEAGLYADPDNRALILRTFPFFLQKYGPSSTLYKEDL